jgi:hypothetical protein
MVMVGMAGLGKTAAHRRAVANSTKFLRPWIDRVAGSPRGRGTRIVENPGQLPISFQSVPEETQANARTRNR